ncbi:MAG: NAD-dependent epimerase/dehydratase family protein [bacterium]|nr:NAD-dependent epimerase/dehydratase family protein [bacterium]
MNFWENKKVLVTGAAGFIGSNLVKKLVDEKALVCAFVRKTDDLRFLPKKGIKIVTGDLIKKSSLIPAIKGAEIIFHLGAKTDFAGETWEDYYLSNVLGTKNLVDLAVKEKIERFIFFATIRTVGLKNSRLPVDETAPYGPVNFYDRSKVEGEKIVKKAQKKHGLPITIIRPSSVYGPMDRGTYFGFFKAIADNRFFLIGKGDNLVSFVYVGNVVGGAMLAAEKKEAIGKTYFINDERPYTMKELSETIAGAFGKTLPPFYLPKYLGYAAGFALEVAGKIFNFTPPLSRERVKNLTINYVFSTEKAQKDLGYKPLTSLAEGVNFTANWYKTHGWI